MKVYTVSEELLLDSLKINPWHIVEVQWDEKERTLIPTVNEGEET
jgi:hypothetical protein